MAQQTATKPVETSSASRQGYSREELEQLAKMNNTKHDSTVTTRSWVAVGVVFVLVILFIIVVVTGHKIPG